MSKYTSCEGVNLLERTEGAGRRYHNALSTKWDFAKQ